MLRRFPSLRVIIPVALILIALSVGRQLIEGSIGGNAPLPKIESAKVNFVLIPGDLRAIISNRTVFIYKASDVQGKSFAAGQEPAIKPGARPLTVAEALAKGTLVLTEKQLKSAQMDTVDAPKPMVGKYAVINVVLTSEGVKRLAYVTRDNPGKQIAISVNGTWTSTFDIEGTMAFNSFRIEPVWSTQLATDMAVAINGQ